MLARPCTRGCARIAACVHVRHNQSVFAYTRGRVTAVCVRAGDTGQALLIVAELACSPRPAPPRAPPAPQTGLTSTLAVRKCCC